MPLTGVFRKLRDIPRKTLIIGISVIVVVSVLFIATAVDTAISLNAIAHSQAQWCDALRLLTKDKITAPSNPGGNSVKEDLYDLHQAYLLLEIQFGCTP
jgi:hypothetical protein